MTPEVFYMYMYIGHVTPEVFYMYIGHVTPPLFCIGHMLVMWPESLLYGEYTTGGAFDLPTQNTIYVCIVYIHMTNFSKCIMHTSNM